MGVFGDSCSVYLLWAVLVEGGIVKTMNLIGIYASKYSELIMWELFELFGYRTKTRLEGY